MAAKVDEVDGSNNPEVEAWYPNQDSVLKTLGEVWIRIMVTHMKESNLTTTLSSHF